MDIVVLPWDGALDELVGSEVTNSTILSVGNHTSDRNEPAFFSSEARVLFNVTPECYLLRDVPPSL